MNDQEAAVVIAALEAGRQSVFEAHSAGSREVLEYDRASDRFFLRSQHACVLRHALSSRAALDETAATCYNQQPVDPFGPVCAHHVIPGDRPPCPRLDLTALMVAFGKLQRRSGRHFRVHCGPPID